MAYVQEKATIDIKGSRVEKSENREVATLTYPIRYQHTHIHKVSREWLNEQRILCKGADRQVVQAYKLLRTQVLKKLHQHHWNSIGVMAARSGQGSTLTAINLAISIALDHRCTALLADFNLRDPSIHRYFDFQPALGVSDYLISEASISDMLFTPNIESLVVLPGREPIEDSAESLVTPGMRSLVSEITGRYSQRIVIYDLPPVLESDDALAFLDQFDAGLLVIEEGVTKKSDINRMAELLGDKPILGTVLNNSRVA
ncbi:MAG: CpsD/CapB family tyrosine-protein kinase [Pseudomonadota bacterium]|nr:CpsD/CapB family tyrosine-protein kinase [Pseudomonadota bacterium]